MHVDVLNRIKPTQFFKCPSCGDPIPIERMDSPPGTPSCDKCGLRLMREGDECVIAAAVRPAECAICRELLGDSVHGPYCARCAQDLKCLASMGSQHGTKVGRMRSPFAQFRSVADARRASEILEKAPSELSAGEHEWVCRLMSLIGSRSPRGRKKHAAYERVARLLARLELSGKPLPSYGDIARFLSTEEVHIEKLDQVIPFLKRRRKSIQLPPPPTET